jgi:hypothetical protein
MSELESSGTSTKKSFNLCDACPRSGTTACPMVEGSQASRDFDAETEERRPSVDRGKLRDITSPAPIAIEIFGRLLLSFLLDRMGTVPVNKWVLVQYEIHL